MEFRNNDPQGDLDIAGVGFVKAGEVFEVTGDATAHFESLPELFPRVDKPKAQQGSKDKE